MDANIEAIRLKADLSAAVGDALYLFKASDAPWMAQQKATSRDPRYYPAGGPLVVRTKTGSLNLIWSSPKNGKSAVVVAQSETGEVRGPWKQRAVLLDDGSEAASVFRTFDGRLMLVLNTKLLELDDSGDVVKARAK